MLDAYNNLTYSCAIIIESDTVPVPAGESVNSELVGGVIGAVLSVVMSAIVLLIVLVCLYRRYCRTAKISTKKIDQ